MKYLKTFLFFSAVLYTAFFFSPSVAAEEVGVVCEQGDGLFIAAKESGEVLFGKGYLVAADKNPNNEKVYMMYDRKTSEWSFLLIGDKRTCFGEGGKNWKKLPFVFPKKTMWGSKFEEHVGHCNSLETLADKLLVNNHKIDIGHGMHYQESFPTNSGIAQIETHFFVDGAGGWTVVHHTTYLDTNTAPLACIQAYGGGWMFLDYYEKHLPPIGK